VRVRVSRGMAGKYPREKTAQGMPEHWGQKAVAKVRRARPLLCGRKILIADRGRVRALDADKRLAGSGMAGVAAVGQLVEGGDKLSVVFRSNRLFKPRYPRIDHGLDHLGDGKPVNGRMKPGCVLEPFF